MAPFEFALQQGFNAFEWFSDKGPRGGWSEDDCDAAARRKIRATGVNNAMRFSVHAPCLASPLDIRGRRAIEKSIRCAMDIEADVVNVHLFCEKGTDAFAEAITPLIESLEGTQILLTVENVPETGPDDFNAFFARILDSCPAARRHLGMCFDMGHANLFHGTRNDYLAYLRRLSPQVPIVHLHAHENYGDRDSHMTLFTGPAARDDSGVRQLLQMLAHRGFAGSAILEQWPNPASQLVTARQLLRERWEQTAYGN
jgi:sugar phosphate isomerase/epimerase